MDRLRSEKFLWKCFRTGVRLPSAPPAKKPVFDLGQRQVSFYFMVAIFLETIKMKDHDSLCLSLASL